MVGEKQGRSVSSEVREETVKIPPQKINQGKFHVKNDF